MTLASGTKLGPYEIVAPLGAGGMGEVYRARDTRLDREVAVKVLPEQLADDSDALRRFEREAKAVAALSHPNILAIHDVGIDAPASPLATDAHAFPNASDPHASPLATDQAVSPLAKGGQRGVSYVVMELLEGETLRARLSRSPFPWRKGLEIGIAIAEGLAAAHARGIVHRDLKPENIFLTEDGGVKILDFGLARAEPTVKSEDRTVTLDTKPGTVLGTICYMSPEQVRGRVVDARSDIFALGCVLYEMLTGKRAFSGDTSADVTTATLTHEPESVADTVSDVPLELDRTISRCLQKSCRRRFQSSDDLAFTLRNIHAGSGRSRTVAGTSTDSSRISGTPSIAVLPFVNRSNDPENEYFSDGISEEIINALTKIEGLRVAARTSAFSFKGKSSDIAEVGQKLNVESVLEGSVQKAGNRVRITAQLSKVADGFQLWSERFDRQLEDVFAVQDEIAHAIVEQLKVKLVAGTGVSLVRRHTHNLDAYNLYLKGRHHWNRMTPDSLREVIRCYDGALRLDPSFAAAAAGKAEAYIMGSYYGGMRPDEAHPKAREAAEKALALDDSLADAHSALGAIWTHHDRQWEKAEGAFKRAIELNANSPSTRVWYSFLLVITRRLPEALTEIRRACELDPLSTFNTTFYGMELFVAGRSDEAVDVLQETISRDPADYYAQHMLGFAYCERLMFTESIAAFRKALDLSGNNPWIETLLALTCYRFGDRSEAERLFDDIRERSKAEYVAPVCFVFIHLIRGEVDEALRWLKTARAKHDPFVCWFNVIRGISRTLNLATDPRIDARLDEMGIP